MTGAAWRAATEMGAAAIIGISESGFTVRSIARFRPAMPILGFSLNDRTVRQLTMSWGTIPLHAPLSADSLEMMDELVAAARDQGHVRSGDVVAVLAGRGYGVGQQGHRSAPAGPGALRVTPEAARGRRPRRASVPAARTPRDRRRRARHDGPPVGLPSSGPPTAGPRRRALRPTRLRRIAAAPAPRRRSRSSSKRPPVGDRGGVGVTGHGRRPQLRRVAGAASRSCASRDGVVARIVGATASVARLVRQLRGRRRPLEGVRSADPDEAAEHFMRRMIGDRLWERLPCRHTGRATLGGSGARRRPGSRSSSGHRTRPVRR